MGNNVALASKVHFYSPVMAGRSAMPWTMEGHVGRSAMPTEKYK